MRAKFLIAASLILAQTAPAAGLVRGFSLTEWVAIDAL